MVLGFSAPGGDSSSHSAISQALDSHSPGWPRPPGRPSAAHTHSRGADTHSTGADTHSTPARVQGAHTHSTLAAQGGAAEPGLAALCSRMLMMRGVRPLPAAPGARCSFLRHSRSVTCSPFFFFLIFFEQSKEAFSVKFCRYILPLILTRTHSPS